MSTRSAIGTATDNGFSARYCHWDGYPSCRLYQVLDTYEQLGRDWEAVVAWAVRPDVPFGSWSSYMTPADLAANDALPEKVECHLCGGTGLRSDDVGVRGGMNVPGGRGCNGCSGTGQAFNPKRHRGFSGGEDERADFGLLDQTDDAGLEYVYLLSEGGVTVLDRTYDDTGARAVGMFGSIGGAATWRRIGFVAWGDEAAADALVKEVEG